MRVVFGPGEYFVRDIRATVQVRVPAIGRIQKHGGTVGAVVVV